MGWLFEEWFFDGITQRDLERFCREMALLEELKTKEMLENE